jgi:uncharacterized protein YbaA (DUF1428 family)
MAYYVDGYVIPLLKNRVDDYRQIATLAAEVWRDHGALKYRECVGEDLNVKSQIPFPQLIDAQSGRNVVFAWITFESREHRDEVNAKVLENLRLATWIPTPYLSTVNAWPTAVLKSSWMVSRTDVDSVSVGSRRQRSRLRAPYPQVSSPVRSRLSAPMNEWSEGASMERLITHCILGWISNWSDDRLNRGLSRHGL